MVTFKKMKTRNHHAFHNHSKRDVDCKSLSVYKSPSTGDTVQDSDPLTISWDTSYASCLGDGVTNIDIHLLSPTSQTGHVKIFSSIPFSAGTYTKNLDSSWWNNTGDIQLTIDFVPTGHLLPDDPFTAGPVINVKSTPGAKSTGGSSDSSDPTLKTSGGVAQGGDLPKGSIAAAVLLPIIAIIIGVAIYVKISRKKRAKRTRRYSEAMNARMSRISGDWQSMAQNHSKFGVRDSSASGLRMSNVFGQGMDMDVREGAERISIANMPYSQSQPIGSRTSRFNPPTVGTRQSRISFAPDVNASKERLSTYSIGRTSRAFPAEDAPPVPRGQFGRATAENPASVASVSVYDTNSIYAVESHEHHDANAVMSPTQTTGPVALSNEDINNIDVGPALSLMRNGGNNTARSGDDLLLTPPAPPTPVHAPGSPLGTSFGAPPLSPLGAMPMQPQMVSAMSPDDMLRQYAKAKAKNSLASTVSSPNPIYSPATPTAPHFTSSGMRNLTGDTSLGR